MKLTRILVVVGLLAVGTTACDKGEDTAKLQEAQREAAEKVAEADREAAVKKTEAEGELREMEEKATAARNEARAEIQKDLAAADRKATDLKERLAKAKGKVKLNGDAASAEYEKRRAVAERGLESLTTATGTAWEGLKAQVEKDVDAVEAALDSFDKTIT